MAIKAVIFDLDGTLANFNLNYKTLRAEARGILLKASVPASLLAVNQSIFEMLKLTEIYFKKSPSAYEQARIKVLEITDKFELEAAQTTCLMSGAVETLKNLKKQGIKMGLCTISSQKSANHILHRFKIAEYFEGVVSREQVKHVKPHPEQVELALKALDVAAENTLVVGDSIADVKAAQESKAVAVGIPTGYNTPQQLTEAGVNYLITALTDLPVLIEEINKA
ncbi:MAG: HAD family phosphatase [Candidatus Bathyarchaeota archaeon]|nr:HAD family phosphatase [Candidatus Bathyarchaeota archaeon]